MNNHDSRRERYDVIIVVPLEEELLNVQKIFKPTIDRSTDLAFRSEVDSGSSGLRILLVQQEGMGRTHAARAASEALSEFDASLIVCLGIAGSLTSDLRLGDVCYSTSIADVLDNARAADDTKGEMELDFAPSHYPSPRKLVAALNFCRTIPELRAKYETWQANQSQLLESLNISEIPRPASNYPNTMPGAIVCGAVSKSARYNKKLSGLDRKVLAIETESGGVFEEAQRRGVHALTIRGISDHANADKSALEKRSSGNVRQLAALNAASFLQHQLSNPNFIQFLERTRESHTNTVSIDVQPNSRNLLSFISELGDRIDDQLRELAPEYKLLERGYRLPTPRMRKIELGVNIGSRPDPIEIRDAIATTNSVLISVERNYPDNSLPWVLANDILTSEIAGKQPLPIVIDGLKVSSPRSTFESLAPLDFTDFAATEGTQLVFVINELPLASRSRLRSLEEQINLYPGAKFILLTRSERLAIAESDFAKALAADVFELVAVSFREITHFVQKNYGMTGSESEVIALRLRETFRHFNLSAHPTYFAGIPREVLAALLQANQRAELIQLAVDGFLTFVVAGDTADVSLTRTTRLIFLQGLAVEMEVEKRSFSQAELIDFTKNFSSEFDFGIDPLAFIKSFVDAGILHFTDDKAEFSLPFIKAYVLARRLVEEPTLAYRYFYSSTEIDLQTFDLYAELGPSGKVVDEVVTRLKTAVSDYAINEGETHVLLTDRVRPALMKNPEQIDVIQRRLRKTAEDIEHGRGDITKKQRVLDLADRVREEVADTAKNSEDEKRQAGNAKIDAAIHSWIVGSILLGSGAERLNGEIKQALAGLLIQFSSIIAHRATELLLELDFEDVKSRLLKDPDVIRSLAESKDERAPAEVKKMIESMVDVLEYTLLASSFRRVLQQLCEVARRKVLATSIEKASVKGEMEKVIHAAWLADIESARGKTVLVSSIKTLPPLPFFRSALAAHFASRVYWNHWKKADRMVLLSAAEECLKGFGAHIKTKAQIQRLIETSKEADNNDLD